MSLSLRMSQLTCLSAVTLAVVSPAIAAAIFGKRLRSNVAAAKAMVYTSLTASFLIGAAGIITTVAVYLTGLCLLYMALLKQKWWKLLRIDAISGAALLFILDIAWWARNLSNLHRGDDEGLTLNWLLVIVDITLAIMTAGVVGVVIYSIPKLKRRTDLDIGNVSISCARELRLKLTGADINPPCHCLFPLAHPLHLRPRR